MLLSTLFYAHVIYSTPILCTHYSHVLTSNSVPTTPMYSTLLSCTLQYSHVLDIYLPAYSTRIYSTLIYSTSILYSHVLIHTLYPLLSCTLHVPTCILYSHILHSTAYSHAHIPTTTLMQVTRARPNVSFLPSRMFASVRLSASAVSCTSVTDARAGLTLPRSGHATSGRPRANLHGALQTPRPALRGFARAPSIAMTLAGSRSLRARGFTRCRLASSRAAGAGLDWRPSVRCGLLEVSLGEHLHPAQPAPSQVPARATDRLCLEYSAVIFACFCA